MAECELVSKCPFFQGKMSSLQATFDIFKEKYCQGDFTFCARFRVYKALGKNKVPLTLFPNQTEKADTIIKNARKTKRS